MGTAFTEEQKQYLQGFMVGLQQSGLAPFVGQTADGRFTADPAQAPANLAAETAPESVYGTPFDKLCKEEKIKLEQNPLDLWERMDRLASTGEFAEGPDVFRWKFHGLFNCNPTQTGYMLRCRIPGCSLQPYQLRGLANIAERYGGGYAHVTTRGNIQVREIQPANTMNTLMKLYDIGLTSRGAGADNIRNITASPLAGVDPQELIDTRPLARAMHHFILNHRHLYGLPRKFNIAFDGGGAVSIMADTNDLSFLAVRVPDNRAMPAGVYFRPMLGGVAGHGHFAKDTDLLLAPGQCVAFAAAVLQVFIEHGNRTNRKRARLAYVIEKFGLDGFLAKVQEKLDFEPPRLAVEECTARAPIDRRGHIGFHPQQDGKQYLGVAMLAGKMTAEQMRRLADTAERYGNGEIRLTIWQNVILPGIADEHIDAVADAVQTIGLATSMTSALAGLAACTGNTGCKFSQTDTKDMAGAIAQHFDASVNLAEPLNVVITGCPNACAQHVCADIGLLGVKTKRDGESIDAYNISVGGGTEQEQGLAREVFKAVPHDQVPAVLARMTALYQQHRQNDESFLDFTRRQDGKKLQAIFESAMS